MSIRELIDNPICSTENVFLGGMLVCWQLLLVAMGVIVRLVDLFEVVNPHVDRSSSNHVERLDGRSTSRNLLRIDYFHKLRIFSVSNV